MVTKAKLKFETGFREGALIEFAIVSTFLIAEPGVGVGLLKDIVTLGGMMAQV